MTRELTKVIYQPDTQKTDEYTIIVNPVEYKKWTAGDTSIPIAEVVDSFQVFFSNQGAQGILGKPSKQQLENDFGTSKDVDVVQLILEKGKLQTGGINTQTFQTNAARGSAIVDSKGKGLSGI